jgi:hypothetical protein
MGASPIIGDFVSYVSHTALALAGRDSDDR